MTPFPQLTACSALADYAASQDRRAWVVVDLGQTEDPRYYVTAASMLSGRETVVYFASDAFGGGKTDGVAAHHVAHRVGRCNCLDYLGRRK